MVLLLSQIINNLSFFYFIILFIFAIFVSGTTIVYDVLSDTILEVSSDNNNDIWLTYNNGISIKQNLMNLIVHSIIRLSHQIPYIYYIFLKMIIYISKHQIILALIGHVYMTYMVSLITLL